MSLFQLVFICLTSDLKHIAVALFYLIYLTLKSDLFKRIFLTASKFRRSGDFVGTVVRVPGNACSKQP